MAGNYVFLGKVKIVPATLPENPDPNEYFIVNQYLMCTTKVMEVEIQRVPYLNNVISVHTDPEGKSFIALQV